MELTIVKKGRLEFPLDQPVNSYYIGEIDTVIDAGIEPAKEDAEYYLITHWHWDHSMGLTSLRDRKICMPRPTLEIIEHGLFEDRFRRILEAGGVRISELERAFISEMGRRYKRVRDSLLLNDVLTLEECPLISKGIVRSMQCPGHSVDHVCFIIGGHVFTGDTLIPGKRTTIVDFREHRRTLLRLLSEPSWRVLHPGHGDDMSREEALLVAEHHSIERCDRVYRILSKIPRGEWVALDNVMATVYGVRPSLRAFVALRTLTGYIKELEDLGIIEVDRTISPWRLRIKG
ncbi:MAG: MBL fold metallo-hydrolase [Desulfurococcales archaeon]|nr:MBL fold metallo-hydrolase [Desulfurococcales archaeon]